MQAIKLVAVVMNDTQYWRENIVARAGAVFTTYLVDLNRPVQLCELTPSYEAIPLYSTPFYDDEDGSVNELLMGAELQEQYIHCRAVDGWNANYRHDIGEFECEYASEDSYQEKMAELVDHYRGNHVLDIPRGFSLPAKTRYTLEFFAVTGADPFAEDYFSKEATFRIDFSDMPTEEELRAALEAKKPQPVGTLLHPSDFFEARKSALKKLKPVERFFNGKYVVTYQP